MRLPMRYGAADQTLVRKMNTSLILECLRTSAPLSRAHLADRTGLNRSTVSNVTDRLLQDGLIREVGLEPSKKGRPRILMELNPDAGCALGIEIDVGFISIVVTDFTAQVLWRQRIHFDAGAETDRVIKWAQELTQEGLDVVAERGLRPLGIGIGIPGWIDVGEGTVIYAGGIRWREVPLKQMWTQRFDMPVFVENAENAATLGEYYFGTADNVHNLIYLVVGYGLGGGIIVRGTLLRGSRGQAGKIGHMVMVPDGVPCRCGRRGCLQTLVNTPAIVRRMQEVLEASAGGEMQTLVASKLGRIDAEMVVEAAEEGDSTAQTVIEEFGVHLGRAISTLVNLFNPELVVLGGAFSLAGPFLLGVIEQVVQEHATLESYKAVKLVTSTHGADACTIGAAALVLDEFLQEPIL